MKDKLSPGAWVALLFGFTVVSVEEEEALTVEFDPVAYVDDNREAVQTAITDNAQPLTNALNGFEPDAGGKVATEDLTPIAGALSRITTGEAHVYSVAGTGIVTDFDVESSKGSIGLDVDGYDGPVAVRMRVGTRIPGPVLGPAVWGVVGEPGLEPGTSRI